MNPLDWGPQVYLALIVGVLTLRLLIPWPGSGPARFVEEVCLILPAGLLYFLVRGLEQGNSSAAYAHARSIVSLERSLGIFVEPRLQQAIGDHSILVDLVNWIYIWAHWPVILVWIVWLWTRHRTVYPLFRNAVLISGAAGMIVFALYPLAPPRLVADLGLVDTVTLRSNSYRVLQPPSLTNIYAAMPSLHFGWNLLVGIAIARNARGAWKTIGVLLPIAMFFAIVLTGNHYILDGVGGAAVALAGLAASTYLTPRWSAALAHVSVACPRGTTSRPPAGAHP